MTRSLASDQNLFLLLCLSPYLALVVVDWRIHDKGRRVPTLESLLHAGIAVSVGAFLAFAFLGQIALGLLAFGVAVAFLAADELGFHRGVSVLERRIHYLADASLLGFMFLWVVTASTR